MRSIATSSDRQTITLSSGEAWSLRLVVLATGLDNSLREQLGIFRQNVSTCHSISVGFDIEPTRSDGYAFPALTYFGETTGSRIGYLTLFPIGRQCGQIFSFIAACRILGSPVYIRHRKRPCLPRCPI